MGSWESEVGSRKSGVGSWESGVGSRKLGVRSWKSGVGSGESGVGSWKLEVGSWKLEGGSRSSLAFRIVFLKKGEGITDPTWIRRKLLSDEKEGSRFSPSRGVRGVCERDREKRFSYLRLVDNESNCPCCASSPARIWSEVGSQESGVRSRELGVGSWESGVGSGKLGVGSWESEVGSWKGEVALPLPLGLFS